MIRTTQIIVYFKILFQRRVLLTCVDPLFLLVYHFVNVLTGKSIIYHVSICWLSWKKLKCLGKVFPKGTGILHFSKASTLVIRSAVRAFTDNFRRSINRFFQVAQYFLLLILTVDSYFVLFMRFSLSAQGCAHLMGKILLDVGSIEIGMFTNIVPTTLQLALIGFLPIGNPFIIKDTG